MSEEAKEKLDDWSPVHTRLRWEIVILSLGVSLFGIDAIQATQKAIFPFQLKRVDDNVMVVVLFVLYLAQIFNFYYRTLREVNEMVGVGEWPTKLSDKLQDAHSSLVNLISTVGIELFPDRLTQFTGALTHNSEIETFKFTKYDFDPATLDASLDRFSAAIERSLKAAAASGVPHTEEVTRHVDEMIKPLHGNLGMLMSAVRTDVTEPKKCMKPQ